MLADVLTKHPLHPSIGAVIVSTAGGVLAEAIQVPVTAGVLVLLYVDLRMRKEGLDLALQTSLPGAIFHLIHFCGSDHAKCRRPAARRAIPRRGGPVAPGAGRPACGGQRHRARSASPAR